MPNDSGDVRFRLFDQLLGLFPVGTLVDLGAGHGKFATRAADAGWRVVAVDARTERFPQHPKVEWRRQDVRETELDGFDLILNLGLFYHLSVDDQLSLLDRSAGTPMILDTHVGAPGERVYGLTPVLRRRGYRGRMYSEKGLQDVPTASFGNLESFWPTQRALVRMLNERGWDVYPSIPYYLPSRTFFLCLPR